MKCLEHVQGPVSCSVVGVAVSARGRWNTEGALRTVGELVVSRPLAHSADEKPAPGGEMGFALRQRYIQIPAHRFLPG